MNTSAELLESDVEFWRRRYTKTVSEMEGELSGLRAMEDILRRVSSRLCIALQGRNRSLDDALRDLREGLRKEGDVASLEPLIGALTAAIEKLDREEHSTDLAAADSSTGADSLAQVLKDLIARIDFDARLSDKAQALSQRLEAWDDSADINDLLDALADLVNKQSHGLQDSLLKFQSVFGRINSRLSEMFEHVALDANAFEAVQASGRTLEQQLIGEVSDLGEEVKKSDDLNALQKLVDRRMQSIEQHLQDFREREQEQSTEYRERAEAMRKRIAELEKQASALQLAMRQQKRKALVDALTGIPNHLAYQRQVETYFRRAERNQAPLCLAVWDIDHFKSINDNFGHKAGDRALQLVARKLAASVRSNDFVARYGGEEFVMLLENSSMADAIPVLDSVRRGIEEMPFHHDDKPVPLTISCGVTLIEAADTADAAFERADAALYQSKRSGRNRVSSA